MDTSDRPGGELSPWSGASLSPRPAPWDDPAPEAAASRRPLNARVVLRALRRHWWQILAIWAVGSAGLVYLAYTKIRPSFEVFSYIEVEPASRALLSPTSSGGNAFEPYLDTQVLLVTNPDSIEGALRDPRIAGLPKIRQSLDPVTELRKDITVVPQRGTHLIMVKMADEDPGQAAEIVNAVVKSYMALAKNWTDNETSAQIEALEALRKNYENEVGRRREALRVLTKKARENPDVDLAAKDAKEKEDGPPGRSRITASELVVLRTELAEVTIARHLAEAAVASLQEELRAAPAGDAAPPAPEQVEAMITEEFLGLPQVAQITDRVDALEAQLKVAEGRIRNHANDPAAKRVRNDLADAKAQYQDLWARMYPRIKQRLERAPDGRVDPVTLSRNAELRQARSNLQQAQIREKLLQERVALAKQVAVTANGEIVDVEFARDDLKYYEDLFGTVRRHLEQLGYEQQSATRITVRAEAKPSLYPSSNSRMKLVLAAPMLMLLLSVGLFVLIEARSGRVADPDELSQRARLGVIGVVPPLPSLGGASRALSVRGQRDEKRRIEEFVQSLDHLRVTLCAHRPGASHRRCVLITSATGGEGKTTLAAQLAGRCANAGLMTLLIDADLRRPSLGDLLEVPEGPGLVDVLAGEAGPEAAMVVIGNAGGFHLLPAGTMGQDPSRLLHGERLGQLIAQFRESFDIVIIDAPPVLAVPDALLLGRWTDGAVLAVRHDTSRFPLVERANKRLASIGVPVLGAVINGCRTMESAYGSYRYTPYAAAETPGAGAPPQDE